MRESRALVSLPVLHARGFRSSAREIPRSSTSTEIAVPAARAELSEFRENIIHFYSRTFTPRTTRDTIKKKKVTPGLPVSGDVYVAERDRWNKLLAASRHSPLIRQEDSDSSER
jgi:hypothetical protein